MIDAIFENDNGKKFQFGIEGGNVFDMNIGNGISVDIGVSQGFEQIGETVETMKVKSRLIDVKGAIYENIPANKNKMRNVISPFSSGKLIIDNKYYTHVFVKSAPAFSTAKNNGKFAMSFLAPFPFFYLIDATAVSLKGVTPEFSFPINYSIPHKFGLVRGQSYTNIVYNGDIKVPFSLKLSSRSSSSNIVITNMNTLKFLKINGEIHAGEEVNIYRTSQNILKAELISGGEITDILSWIDEDSNLFELEFGDNVLQASDDDDGANLEANLIYNTVVATLYED